MAVTSAGAVMAWGDNAYSKLGLGSNHKELNVWVPQQCSDMYDLQDLVWVRVHYESVWVGHRHSAGINQKGQLFMWGDNSSGQLGLGHKQTCNIPTPTSLGNVKCVALGFKHSAAIDKTKKLHTWGDCGEGRLGHGQLYEEEKPGRDEKTRGQRKILECLMEPKVVEHLRARGVMSVACGDRFTSVVDTQGSLWSFGSGVYGQLGRGRAAASSDNPQLVEVPADAGPLKHVTTTAATMAFWGDAGKVMGCGRSLHGVMTDDDAPSFAPTQFGVPPGLVRDDLWPERQSRAATDEAAERNGYIRHLAMSDGHCCCVMQLPPVNAPDFEKFGIALDPLPNASTGGHVLLASHPRMNPLNNPMTHREGTKRARYGRMELSSNVVGRNEDGTVSLDMGGEAGVVRAPIEMIHQQRPTSLATIRAEAPVKKEPLVDEGDADLDGFDLVAVLETMHAGGYDLHPLLDDATPAECKSSWASYSRPPCKDDAAAQAAVTKRRASDFSKDEVVDFKMSMAVEKTQVYHEFHASIAEFQSARALYAHNRARHGEGGIHEASSLRMSYINGAHRPPSPPPAIKSGGIS